MRPLRTRHCDGTRFSRDYAGTGGVLKGLDDVGRTQILESSTTSYKAAASTGYEALTAPPHLSDSLRVLCVLWIGHIPTLP